MWVITNTGLVSIVANRSKGFQDTFLVRARRRKDLHEFFGSKDIDEYIIHNPDADYHYRVLADADTVKGALFQQVNRITYGNFKDSIPESDHDLKKFATETWLAGFRNLNEEDESKQVPVLSSVNTSRKDERRR